MISFGGTNLWKCEKEDLGVHYQWSNNDNLRRLACLMPQPRSLLELQSWYVRISEDPRMETYTIKTNLAAAIGWLQLSDINLHWGTADLGIVVDEHYWGQGYGHDALVAVLKYSFEELRLNRLNANIQSINSPSRRLFEKLGFQHEGTRREAFYCSGRFLDLEVYGLLAREFQLPEARTQIKKAEELGL